MKHFNGSALRDPLFITTECSSQKVLDHTCYVVRGKTLKMIIVLASVNLFAVSVRHAYLRGPSNESGSSTDLVLISHIGRLYVCNNCSLVLNNPSSLLTQPARSPSYTIFMLHVSQQGCHSILFFFSPFSFTTNGTRVHKFGSIHNEAIHWLACIRDFTLAWCIEKHSWS